MGGTPRGVACGKAVAHDRKDEIVNATRATRVECIVVVNF